jgi:hypothetical protein
MAKRSSDSIRLWLMFAVAIACSVIAPVLYGAFFAGKDRQSVDSHIQQVSDHADRNERQIVRRAADTSERFKKIESVQQSDHDLLIAIGRDVAWLVKDRGGESEQKAEASD